MSDDDIEELSYYKPKYKEGSIVRCIYPSGGLRRGATYKVLEIRHGDPYYTKVYNELDMQSSNSFYSARFELAHSHLHKLIKVI